MMIRCTKRNCPMQIGTVPEDCNLENCKYKTPPITNADVIRSMSNSELFDFIQRIELNDIDYGETFCSKDFCDMSAEHCDKCLQNWLNEDAQNHPQGLLYYSKEDK